MLHKNVIDVCYRLNFEVFFYLIFLTKNYKISLKIFFISYTHTLIYILNTHKYYLNV